MPLLILLAIVGFWVLWLLGERKRREGILELAKQYNMEVDPERRLAPDPDIPGFIFGPRYSRYLQGQLRGIRVVALDYNMDGIDAASTDLSS